MTRGTPPTTVRPFSVSVIVPVYNGAATLPELTRRIRETLAPHVSSLEIILVNDGSRDGSWRVICELGSEYPEVRGLDLMRNYGQHSALLAGTQCARYEVTVTLDDDLQHPPEEIPRLLLELLEGYDIVYGQPAERSHSPSRNLSSKALKLILGLMVGEEIARHSSAFRVFRTALRRGFDGFRGQPPSLDVLLSWSTRNVTHVPVKHDPRREGGSGYSLRKLLVLALGMLTGYSTLPLRFASAVGLLTSVGGLVVFLYQVIRRLFQSNYVPGFAFLASEIALFAGLQLFAIGVIGEYLAQVHVRSMGKPPYVVREEVGRNVLPE